MENETPAPIPPEVLADLRYAIELMISGQRAPEFEARVRAEGEKIRQELRRKYGELNIAVDLIREGRDAD